MSEFNPNTPVEEGEVIVTPRSYDPVQGYALESNDTDATGSSYDINENAQVNVRWNSVGGIIGTRRWADDWYTPDALEFVPKGSETALEISKHIYDYVSWLLDYDSGGSAYYHLWRESYADSPGCVIS